MAFLLIVVLGLFSSVMSAILAAIILVEMVNAMPLSRKSKIDLTIIACFSIGLGAALTPLGEPLSTIAISKLSGEPYHAGFDFLFNMLGLYILPGILAYGIIGMFFLGKVDPKDAGMKAADYNETVKDVVMRAVKVYVFIMALVLLGDGFKPIIFTYFTQIPSTILFWVNMVSAILDNATLAAAEIGPALSELQIKSILDGTFNCRRHADSRKYPEHHLCQQIGYNQQGMGKARSTYGTCLDGYLFRYHLCA